MYNKTSWAMPALIVVAGLVVVGWLFFKPLPDLAAGQVTVAEPAQEMRETPKENVVIPTVQVYQGGAKVKKKLTLPSSVVDDDKQKVIASSRIPGGERAKTVTTVIDTESGKSQTYVRVEPLPWLAYESRGEVGLYYGIKNGQPTTRLQVRQDLVQVKALHAGVIGSVDIANGKPDYFVGVGVAYRW